MPPAKPVLSRVIADVGVSRIRLHLHERRRHRGGIDSSGERFFITALAAKRASQLSL